MGGNKAICRPRYALLGESLFWGPNATTFLYPVSVGTWAERMEQRGNEPGTRHGVMVQDGQRRRNRPAGCPEDGAVGGFRTGRWGRHQRAEKQQPRPQCLDIRHHRRLFCICIIFIIPRSSCFCLISHSPPPFLSISNRASLSVFYSCGEIALLRNTRMRW